MKKHNFVNKNNYDLINVSNHLHVWPFNPQLTDSLRPQGKLEKKVIRLEELENSMKKIEKEDPKTLFLKYKLFKSDISGLVLVDTGNLVKGALVSKEFW